MYCTWALPHLELLSTGGNLFRGDYDQFVVAFNKRFAPLDSAEAVWDVLKQIKQGRSSVAEYQAKFDQYTAQTGWSNANHRTRFYNGLSEAIKDNQAISVCPIGTLTELRQAAQILDQWMHQQQAEKTGKPMHTQTQQSSSRALDAMEVDASCQQQQSGKKVHNRQTYVTFMKGKCYGCGSTDHNKKDRKHKQDICNHCRKVRHHSLVCFSKYMGKPIATKVAATEQESLSASSPMPKGKALVSTTAPVLVQDSKGQADLLAQLMAQIKAQSAEIEALKASF